MRTRLTLLLHHALRRKAVRLKTLQHAIAERQIVPFYQPFVDTATGRLAGIEVLARWIHPLHFTPELTAWFAALRRRNIAIALDDFGTGYSNLGYISALNPEFIKIDKTFTRQIGVNDDTRLVDGLISLAHHLQLKVVAEGVETAEQADYLRARKVDFLQGYYFSQPLSGADLTGKIEK